MAESSSTPGAASDAAGSRRAVAQENARDLDPIQFEAWLAERFGDEHGRRIASLREDRILLTKTEPGLAADVLDAVDRLPGLVDFAVLAAAAPADAGGVAA